MPTVKQKKSGDYYIHAPGDQNPVNTFQLGDRGKRILQGAEIGIGEYVPWNLLFLLDDLSYLSTKGEGKDRETIDDRSWIEKSNPGKFSVRQRVAVLDEVVQDRGPEVFCDGTAVDWFVSLLEEGEDVTAPLTDRIASSAGFSRETAQEWGWHPLLVAFTLYLHFRWLRDEASFEDMYRSTESIEDREIVDATEEVVYLEVPYDDIYAINHNTQPGELPDALEKRVSSLWVDQGAGIFHAFHAKEIQRYDSKVEEGVVLPRERLDDYPVSPPPRSELSDLYEALRQFKTTVNRILTAEETDVQEGDDSPCDRWHERLQGRLYGTSDSPENGQEFPALAVQQRTRASTTITTYRDFYGDSDEITEFEKIEVDRIDDEAGVLLYGLGVFETGEHIVSPVAPESDQPLPLYPRSDEEFQHGCELLEEFPAYPKAK